MSWWEEHDDRDCGCGGRYEWHDGRDHDPHGDHGHHDLHGHHEHHGDHDDRHHRRRRLIPIGNVTVDCNPVTFRTPGQAVNVVSCPVSRIIPGTPCIATIHLPPIQTPVLHRHRHHKDCGCF